MQRFWIKVKKTPDCWLWKAGKNRGYGAFSFQKKQIKAHRFSWKLRFGKIPVGLQVCHKCDNPICVRPSHLFLGTHADNHRDKVIKARSPIGEKNGRTFLCDSDVRDIRKMLSNGLSALVVADAYGLKKETICAIKYRKTWKHI